MQRSKDRRQTTHHVEQSWLARFWIVPFNTGWHLAHHVDMGVPWRNLPQLHAELERRRLGHPRLHLPHVPRPVAGPAEPPGLNNQRLCTLTSACRTCCHRRWC